MAEAKARNRHRQRVLEGELRCIYCAALPDSVEHMPPTSMFKGKSRPKGMEFASCTACNNGTTAADVVAAFIARVGPFDSSGSWQVREALGLRSRLAAKAPGVLQELFGGEYPQERWLRNPQGILVKTTVIQTQGAQLKQYLAAFSAKLGMALYRKHVGVALPLDGTVCLAFYLNSGPPQHVTEAILAKLPSLDTLRAGRHEVSSQFSYRYNTDECSIVLGLAAFHMGLFVVVLATSRPDFFHFQTIRFLSSLSSREALRPSCPNIQRHIPHSLRKSIRP